MTWSGWLCRLLGVVRLEDTSWLRLVGPKGSGPNIPQSRQPGHSGRPALCRLPCSVSHLFSKLKPDFPSGSPWPPCPSPLHPAGHPHSSGWLQPWPGWLPRPAWCSQAATARVQMPADPKPPLGTTQKVQWPGWLPGTLSLPGLSFVYRVAQENCPGREPKPRTLQQPAARGV